MSSGFLWLSSAKKKLQNVAIDLEVGEQEGETLGNNRINESCVTHRAKNQALVSLNFPNADKKHLIFGDPRLLISSPTTHYLPPPPPPPNYYSSPQLPQPHVVAPQSRQETTQQRKRPKYTRSKTGCLTCRVKKIKCDETKPNCMRCTHGQRDVDADDGDFSTSALGPKVLRHERSRQREKILWNWMAVHLLLDHRYRKALLPQLETALRPDHSLLSLIYRLLRLGEQRLNRTFSFILYPLVNIHPFVAMGESFTPKHVVFVLRSTSLPLVIGMFLQCLLQSTLNPIPSYCLLLLLSFAIGAYKGDVMSYLREIGTGTAAPNDTRLRLRNTLNFRPKALGAFEKDLSTFWPTVGRSGEELKGGNISAEESHVNRRPHFKNLKSAVDKYSISWRVERLRCKQT
ncbi:hypothetical protein GG344DRAFT_60921 [Lentinula edodes]|nr:hypothetical protein GG344DRAFT_60921 [Lentinula edodes]